MPASFVNNDTLRIAASVLSGKTVTGAGPIILTTAVADGQTFDGLTGSGQYYSITFVGGVTPDSMPATFVNNDNTLTIDADVLSGKTVSGTGPITLNSAVEDGETFDGLTGSGTITFVGGVTPASMPATFVNNNALLTIDADVLSGKTVTGSGPITLNSAVADGETFAGITSSGTITFVGGNLPASMPATFVNNASLTIDAAVLSGKTVTGSGPITLNSAVANSQTFAGITGSGENYSITFVGGVTPASMPATFVNNASLTIYAAVLSGKTVTGSGDLVIKDLGTALFSANNISTSGAITYITSNETQTLDASTTLYTSNSASSHSLLIDASRTLTCAVSQIATTGQEINVAQWSGGSGVGTVSRLSTNASMIVNLNNNTNADLSKITLNTVTYKLSGSMTGTHKFLNSSLKINLFLNNQTYTVGSDVAMTNQLRNDRGTNSDLAKLNVYDLVSNIDGLYILFDFNDSASDRTKPLSINAARTAADISNGPGTQGYGYTTTAEHNADTSRTAGALIRSTGTGRYTNIAGIAPLQNPGQGYIDQYQTITIRDTSMEELVNEDPTKAGTFFQIFAYNFNLIKTELF
jgi:hypothetical protein